MTRRKGPSRNAPRAAGKSRGGPLGPEIHRRIADEVHRRIAASPGGHLVDGRLGELELRLKVNLRDAQAGAEGLAEALESALANFVEDAVEDAAAFRPGHAFCHRCESAECGHAMPAGPRLVFAGYSPTGIPRWSEFGELCLQRRHPRIDRLYDERRPEVLTLEIEGSDLKADLLQQFHRSARHHDVAGQVCAGVFRVPGAHPDGLALTFQVVVTTSRRGGRRVGLNVIGGGESLAFVAPEAKPWRAAVTWGQAKLEEISRRAASGRMQQAVFDRRVSGVLGGIARRVERDLRGRGRRTRHAEERHLSGARPTRKALEDLRGAGEDDFLVDSRHGTLVVLGSRGRTHFFATEGRLVSSVQYPRETIQKKIRMGQWRLAGAGAAEALRSRVEETTRSEAGTKESKG